MPATTRDAARDAAPRQPQDHLPKASQNGAQRADEGEHRFTFTHNGETYTFAESLEKVATGRWLRTNRRRDQLDLAFTVCEEIAGEEALAAIDDMDHKELAAFAERLGDELGELFQ